MMLARLLALLLCALLTACASRAPRRAESTPRQSAGTSGIDDDVSRPQSQRYRKAGDGGPDGPAIDVSKIPEPVPRAEPRSRYGNKERYEVLGKSYRVMNDARGYVERGIASWYGNKFHGYLTSSFEKYDMYAFSAAHKTLPLPSYARVTNLDNGKSVIVRVNDRGPFHDNRLIDLSYAAAVKIGVWPKGTGVVEVRAIDPSQSGDAGSTTASASPANEKPVGSAKPPAIGAAAALDSKSSAIGHARIFLQLGAFGERANAERSLAQAQRAGLADVSIATATVEGRSIHRVRLGPLADAAAADAMSRRIERLGLGTPRVAIEN